MVDVIEQTLLISSPVHLFTLPGPRPAAGGWRSGEWRVTDKIFTGRLRLMAVGDTAECRFEDEATGDLFVTSFVRPGQRMAAVEPAADSSRYFVIRVEDPVSGRHTFLGMGFDERSPAFDFNIALTDHDRRVQRASASEGALEGVSAAVKSEAASLNRPHQDLSLKEGQTIKINLSKKAGSSQGAKGGKLMARLDGGAAGAAGSADGMFPKLAPPPGDPFAAPHVPLPAPPAATPTVTPAVPPPEAAGGGSGSGSSVPSGWATFD